MVSSLLKGQPPQLSSGAMLADWIYVDGLLAAAAVPRAVGEEIDLGTGTLLSMREVVDRIVEMLQPRVQPQFGARPDRPGEPVRTADTGRTWALLGWRATTPLPSDLERTIAWYRQRLELM